MKYKISLRLAQFLLNGLFIYSYIIQIELQSVGVCSNE